VSSLSDVEKLLCSEQLRSILIIAAFIVPWAVNLDAPRRPRAARLELMRQTNHPDARGAHRERRRSHDGVALLLTPDDKVGHR